VLKLTIFWFALFTFLSGFTQNFEQLLVVRGLQGLGFGGEWGGGRRVDGREHSHPVSRGALWGLFRPGGPSAWGLSVILFTILFSRLPACNRLAGYVLDRHLAPHCSSFTYAAR